jgi:hypothetical protein
MRKMPLSLSGDVGHHNEKPPVVEQAGVVIVAAHQAERLVVSGQLRAGWIRERGRKQTGLDLPRGPVVLFDVEPAHDLAADEVLDDRQRGKAERHQSQQQPGDGRWRVSAADHCHGAYR